MSELTELESADRYCRYLTRRHYENFDVVSAWLPRRIALDLSRIYAFCRATDDLGDESGSFATERLERWRSEVDDLFAGRMPVHPVLLALRETVTRCGMNAQPFCDLIAANVQDQQVSSYECWPELQAYCRLSAAPVGRMVLAVFGACSARAAALSDDVCVGLQLANHAQDVARDGARGRCYLLASDIRAGGTAFAVRAMCQRAAMLLASGEELERMVPFPLRVQLALYRLGGLAVVHAIEREGFATDRVRPVVTRATKLRLLARALVQSLREVRNVHNLETA